jgi:hypothetical protein
MYRVIYFGMMLILLSSIACADVVNNEKDARKLCDSIMSSVSKGDLKGAFNKMKPHVPITETEVDSAYLQSKTQRDQFKERYGPTTSHEYIDSKSIGASLLRLRYIEKTKKHAFPWSFYFYKQTDKWTINVFYWNDRIQELFQ